MIFARFMTIYGHKFKSVFQSEDEIRIAKREWALSLRAFSEQELVRAVDRCKEEFVWMPTIAEFLKLLRLDFEAFGLPATLTAYEEACRFADHPREHHWRHPAVYFAGRETQWFRLRSEEKRQVFGDFEHNYAELCRRVVQGEDLAIPLPKGLPDRSDNTRVDFVREWGEKNGVPPEQAATLLYYLSKPKGAVRSQLRSVAQERARKWGLEVLLPEEAAPAPNSAR